MNSIAERINIAKEELRNVQFKIETLRQMEFLIHINKTGTVTGIDRHMGNVVGLLEEGYIVSKNDHYELTPAGLYLIEGWE